MWRTLPAVLAVAVAPLLFGCVDGDGQAVVGLLVGVALWVSPWSSPGFLIGKRAVGWWIFAGAILLASCIPLPVSWHQLFRPAQGELYAMLWRPEGISPPWMPLTFSPAGTVQRIWEVAIGVGIFLVFRRSAGVRGFLPLAAAVLLAVACAEVLIELGNPDTHRRAVLGLWTISSGSGAGTFANRNHYASWILSVALLGSGLVLRYGWPLHHARLGRERLQVGGPWVSAAAAGGVLVAVVGGVLVGSRGAFAGFAVGGVLWGVLLRRHSRSLRRATWLTVAGGLATVVLVAASEVLTGRFAMVGLLPSGGYGKWTLWVDACRMWMQFPMMGVGWGAFEPAFNYFKTFGGDSSFIHVENEYLQALVEGGVLGFSAMMGIVATSVYPVARRVWCGRFREPELVFGASAALAMLLAHASVEFVFRVPALLWLGAALAGMISGATCEVEGVPESPVADPWRRVGAVCGVVFGACLMWVAVRRGAAEWTVRQATQSSTLAVRAARLEASVKWWPWNVRREGVRVRTVMASVIQASMPDQRRMADRVGGEVLRRLRRDPLQWEVWLEKAWLDVAYSRDRRRAAASAVRAIRLNPLQPRIPLGFARAVVRSEPWMAVEFIQRLRPMTGSVLSTALSVLWESERDASMLWSVVPDDGESLTVLGRFAEREGLRAMAVQAYERAYRHHRDPVRLASALLPLGGGRRILELLPQAGVGTRADVIRCRALLQLGQYAEAMARAELTWRTSAARSDILMPVAADRLQLRVQTEEEREAEALMAGPSGQRDPGVLQRLSAARPESLRIRYLLFRALAERGEDREAAGVAVDLAERSIR